MEVVWSIYMSFKTLPIPNFTIQQNCWTQQREHIHFLARVKIDPQAKHNSNSTLKGAFPVRSLEQQFSFNLLHYDYVH